MLMAWKCISGTKTLLESLVSHWQTLGYGLVYGPAKPAPTHVVRADNIAGSRKQHGPGAH